MSQRKELAIRFEVWGQNEWGEDRHESQRQDRARRARAQVRLVATLGGDEQTDLTSEGQKDLIAGAQQLPAKKSR